MENSLVKSETKLSDYKSGVDNLLAQRDYFKQKVEPILIEKQDYFTILGKKSLAKGGAEKLASIFNLTATFERDKEGIEMLGDVKGLVAYVCNLTNRNGQIVGQGRGADTLQRNQNDPNKTIKMAQKRAYVDAVIRTTGLSDIFTQDLEDEPNNKQPFVGNEYSKKIVKDDSITPNQEKFIKDLMKQKGKTVDLTKVKTKKQAKAVIDEMLKLPAMGGQNNG